MGRPLTVGLDPSHGHRIAPTAAIADGAGQHSGLAASGFGHPLIMPSRRVPLIVGSVVIVAVTRALIGLVLGESVLGALVGGVLFAVLFVPIFFLFTRALDRRHRRGMGLSGDSTFTTSNDPISVTATCEATGSVETVADAVEQQIVELKGRPRRTTGPDDQVEVSAGLGSRLALRFFGIYLSAGRRRIPMQLRVKVHRNGIDGVVANIEACSDEGWYLVRVSSLEVEYRQRLDALVAQLRDAVSGSSSARD
jgi:hypothetical protein